VHCDIISMIITEIFMLLLNFEYKIEYGIIYV